MPATCSTCHSVGEDLLLCAAGKHARCKGCRQLPIWRGSCPACLSALAEGLCPVCLDSPVCAYVQCQNGHTMCAPCSERIDSCPQCRVALSATDPIRALQAEQAAEAADAVVCARCGRPSSRSSRWEHECPPALRRLLSRVYTTHTAHYRGSVGEEEEIKRCRNAVVRGSAPRLLKCVYADRVELYAGPPGHEVRVRTEQADGRVLHYNASTGALSVDETEAERVVYDTEGRKAYVAYKRGHEHQRQRWKLAPDGSLTEKLFLPPHELKGQTHHFKGDAHVKTTLDADHPQAGETWHFEDRRHVRTTFAASHVRQGQVAHILNQRHVFTTFERSHTRRGDVVFFDSRTCVHASFTAQKSGPFHHWASCQQRARCLSCLEKPCPCFRGALCVGCYHRVLEALAPAGDEISPGDVVVSVRDFLDCGKRVPAESVGVVESRHATSGHLHVRFCVCREAHTPPWRRVHLCASSGHEENNMVEVELAPRRPQGCG